ncbi:MAG: hypothetical protein GDA51_07655 [Ekhidna sp.]|nr:hypothetical protein [Ekhidna sp.]MBC6426332.1 hypothetical protein [Ekhidna sp.]
MNTIEILSRLEQVNFTTEQARVITEIIEDRQSELATKNDLKPLATKDGLQTEILKAKYDLVRWIVGALILNVGLVVGLVFALIKLFI